MLIPSKYFKIALFFFFIIAIIGALLRATQTYGLLSSSFSNILQTHSHVAFLGWGFLGTIYFVFKNFELSFQKADQYLLNLLIFSILGMMFTFPMFGYKIVPILFLILFLFISYGLIYRIWSKIQPLNIFIKLILKWGLFYYLLSSIAVWIIPVVLIKIGKTALYYNLIYFYLHFLYNGFFTFILWALIFKKLAEEQHIVLSKAQKSFFILLNVACIPSFFLSLYSHESQEYIYGIGIFSATIQLVSLVYLSQSVGGTLIQIKRNKIFSFIYLVFVLKIILQFLSSFPKLSEKAIQMKPYLLVGYLHLFTIGFLSFVLLWLYNFKQQKSVLWGKLLLLIGFIATEFILFYQGSNIFFSHRNIPRPFEMLLMGSIFMVIGIMLILSSFFTFPTFLDPRAKSFPDANEAQKQD